MKFKTLKCLVVGAVLVCAFALIPVSAATNHTVTFKSGRIGTNLWTGGKEKTTDSSVYMYCSSIVDYGVSSAAQYDGYVEGAIDNNGYEDCSHGYVYNFRQGTTRYMFNWVQEDLNPNEDDIVVYAGVRAIAPSGSVPLNATASWRPDC